MKNLLTWISKSRFPYKPLINIEISRSKLIHNASEFIKLAPNNRIIPTLKSNAYGHGILQIASILETAKNNSKSLNNSIPFFAVDSYFEAVNLRSNGFKTPLLIIGYTRPEDIINSNLKNISFVITSIQTLRDIAVTKKSINVHIKFDTGMHRQGILPGETDEVFKILKSHSNIVLEGICSHFADADCVDANFTLQQIEVWNKIVKKFEQNLGKINYVHISNTHGHKYTDKVYSNISRLGIGLYGLTDDFDDRINLSPVLQMKTEITSMKQISKGESIGYNHTFTASTSMKIATIPVGYYEGLDRRLSNIGFVKFSPNEKFCPIVGRISMNISTIDISNIADTKISDEIIVISNNKNDKNSICNMAKLANTIPYEIVIHIPEHLKRTIVD